MNIRTMTIDDYHNVYHLWQEIEGFGIRSIDDSQEGISRFLTRNPNTSVVAEENGEVVGSILCGHDGRTGYFYHVCVKSAYRNRGIATSMTKFAFDALKKERINKVSLVAFTSNRTGNTCWHELGWKERVDLNFYDFILNHENTVTFNDVSGNKIPFNPDII